MLPVQVSPDALGVGLMVRGVAARQASDAQMAADAAKRGVAVTNTVAIDPRWEGLFQALAEAGAGKVKLDGGPGGFFARQGQTTTGQQQQLLDALRVNDVNTYGADYTAGARRALGRS